MDNVKKSARERVAAHGLPVQFVRLVRQCCDGSSWRGGRVPAQRLIRGKDR